MNRENSKVLWEILDEFQQQYCVVQQEIEANMLKIENAKAFLISGSGSTEEMDKVRTDMIFYEEHDEKLSSISQNMVSKIERLKMVLQEESDCNIKLLNIQEDERYRIARDLHDTSLQNLAHLVHKIELGCMYIDKDPLRAKLELSVVSKNLKNIIEDIRNTIFNLRPMEFDDLGLKAVFERLIDYINIDKRYEVDFYVEEVSCENSIILLTLYRAVQECLNNIVKHAEATKIDFHAGKRNETYYILIKDNGKGFVPEVAEDKLKSHFGLSLVKERISVLNGNVYILSGESGTKIEMEIPINDNNIIG